MTKNFGRPLALITIAISLSGCGTHRVYSAQDVTNETQIEHDKYQGLTFVRGVQLGTSMPGQLDQRQIVTSLDANGAIVATWIDYDESGPDMPILFIAAHDASARPLRLEKLDRERKTKDAYAAEDVAVYLPAGYLRDHLHGGIDIQIEGRRGNRVVSFGDDYIGGYWAKLQIAQACVKAKSC